MRHGDPRRGVVLALAVIALLLVLSLPASAAGPKRIFITKYDEKFKGMAGVTFELYEDTDGDGVRDDGEPLKQTKVTDAAGSATFDPMPPGKYIVREVTPSGYVDNPDQAVEIKDAKGKGPSIVFSNTLKPTDHRVNDPSGDASVGDGTNISDFGPSIAVACEEQQGRRPLVPGDPCPDPEILVAWNRSAGFPTANSGIGTAISDDGGVTWEGLGQLPTGSASTFVLGEPQAAYDPVARRWVIVGDAVTNTGSGLLFDVAVWTSGAPSGFWNDPVHLPGLPLAPAAAHGPTLEIDPETGNVFVVYTQSNADGTSHPAVSVSTDGGQTFSPPNPIAGPGSHFDFIDTALGRDGALNVVFGGFGHGDFYDVYFDRSAQPLEPWGATRTVAGIIPRSGTPGLCGNSSLRSVFGRVAALDAPSIAMDPSDPSANTVYVALARLGLDGDESDGELFRSTDGGAHWTSLGRTGSEPGQAEIAPKVAVSPDGHAEITQLLAQLRSLQDLQVSVEIRFLTVEDTFFEKVGIDFDLGTPVPLATFDLWQTNPSFDTNYANCFGLSPVGTAAPGSGFLMAWADGRDPGPAGNGGIDPNIYFAAMDAPPFGTELTATVRRTASALNPRGTLFPPPVPGAKVTVTLFRDDGDGFERIGRTRPKTNADGEWSTSFDRPGDGTCRIVVEFAGAVGRAPSVPVTKTVAC